MQYLLIIFVFVLFRVLKNIGGNIMEDFEIRVEKQLNCLKNESRPRKATTKTGKAVMKVIDSLKTYPPDTKFEDLAGDEALAIQLLRKDTGNYLVDRLRRDYITNHLSILENQLEEEGEEFIPLSILITRIPRNHSDENIKTQANKLLRRIYKIIVKDIPKKYSCDVNIEWLSFEEKEALITIGSDTEPDTNNDPVIHVLYEKVKNKYCVPYKRIVDNK